MMIWVITMSWKKLLDQYWPELENGDAKAIHEVRKLTRKAGALLRAYEAPRKVQRSWQVLRRSISDIRDWDITCDILSQELLDLGASIDEQLTFVEQWKAERAYRWAYVVLPPKPLRYDSPKHADALLHEALQADWLKLKREAERILPTEEFEAWHAWRKRLKRFRYTLEALDTSPIVLLDTLNALGQMQDAQTIQRYLQEHHWLPKYQEQLLARMEQRTHNAVATVRHLWPVLKAFTLPRL